MESTSNIAYIIMMSAIGFFVLLVIGIIFARLYTRANKERAFVRTGFGGEKIIKDGGAIVLPVLHEIIYVNMNTLRLEVRRSNDQALITKDRLRV
ncbi:MAG TPA: flotillin family protein, partial [Cellvibrionaceae bacterium]